MRKKTWILLTTLLLGSYSSARAGGQPLHEERLINVETPHVVGKNKWRFDFQHSWPSGETFSPRLPVADLNLYYGITPNIQARFEALFHNEDIEYRAANGTTKKAI